MLCLQIIKLFMIFNFQTRKVEYRNITRLTYHCINFPTGLLCVDTPWIFEHITQIIKQTSAISVWKLLLYTNIRLDTGKRQLESDKKVHTLWKPPYLVTKVYSRYRSVGLPDTVGRPRNCVVSNDTTQHYYSIYLCNYYYQHFTLRYARHKYWHY